MSNFNKIYISVDIEGLEGVVSRMSAVRGQPDYPLIRKRLANSVNAAIKACFDCNVKEVVVCDGHGDMENLIIEDLDLRATLISGCMRSSLQMELIDKNFDGFISFGHSGDGMSMAGTINHTYNAAKVHNVRINGVTMNTETVLNAVFAGYYNVPLIAVIGDDAVVNEVKQFVPQAHGIIVKKAISRFCAQSLHPVEAQKLIYEGVKNALMQKEKYLPLKTVEPATMEVDFKGSNQAEVSALIPGVERYAPRSIRYTGAIKDIYNIQQLCFFRLIDM